MDAQDYHKETKLFGKVISPEKISPSGHIRCATDEYEKFLREKDPKRKTTEQFEAEIAPIVERYRNPLENTSQSGGIIYIPVVVHVIHNGDAYGVNENITDEQVESQITVMNQDYRKMLGTPGYNTNPVGADIQIEFVLAKVDPNGNPTNGIDRVNMCQSYWDMTTADETLKPATIWNPTQYMNMWSVNFGGDDATTLGYAQFPSTGFSTANTDGVVAGYGYFGSSDLAAGNFAAPYDKGRTMTHEVGHFLGLYHTFEGGCAGENNTSGDYCADTPAVSGPNFGCSPTDSCPTGSADMIENYMDYTDDTCMNIFTLEQKARAVAVMNTYPRRTSLKTSTKDLPITLFANDAEVQIENYCSGSGNPCIGNQHKVLLYNRGTSNLTSATISYNISGGANSTYNWTGNLATNKYEVIVLNTEENTGTLNVFVSATNGIADQRASNDSTSKSFSFPAPSPVTEYAYTTFHMTLVKDNYGSETSWDLKNSSNSIVYSGGPYTNGGSGTTVYNADWTLPADCYTFTIYDAYGDGICCTYGNGSYTITANSGATTIATGGDFESSESISFSNAILSNSNFALETVSLYPNPTSSILNIRIPNDLGNEINYQVINNLGQVVNTNKSEQNDFIIDTSALSNGVYFIKLDVNSNSKVFKFIKN